MATKPSGLGRGLGELLEDNSPSLRQSKPTVVAKGASEPQKTAFDPYKANSASKVLPKNKSVKANFRQK